jgi:hypothetical protein
MNYETIDAHTYNQCIKAKLKVRLAGCHLDVNDEVLVFHKFRIFKPELKKAMGPNDKFVAFEVDGQLFDNFFTVLEVSPNEKVKLDAQKAKDAQKKK